MIPTTSRSPADPTPDPGEFDPFSAARAEALNRLARPARSVRRPGRSLFDRARPEAGRLVESAGSPAPGGHRTAERPPHGAGEGHGPDPRRSVGRAGWDAVRPDQILRSPAAVVVAAGVLVVLVVAAVWLRRPPPPEDTLPRAAASPAGRSADVGSPGAGPGSAVPATVPGGSNGSQPGEPVAEHAVTVHVAGAVVRPGVVTLPAGSRAVDAVSAAGGLAAGADPDRVNLAAALSDGQRLVIPLVGQPPPAEFVPSPPPTGAGSAAGSPATQGPVDLNTATEADLDRLPGIGPATAAAIVSHRSLHGPFRTVEDLLDVRGIGEAKLDALRGLISVSP